MAGPVGWPGWTRRPVHIVAICGSFRDKKSRETGRGLILRNLMVGSDVSCFVQSLSARDQLFQFDLCVGATELCRFDGVVKQRSRGVL